MTEFSPKTLPRLVQYLKERGNALEQRASLDETYHTPHMSPINDKIEKDRLIAQTLREVLKTIQDIELEHFKDDLRKALEFD